MPETHSAVNSSGGAPAVARAAAILRLLARAEEPLGVNAIAKQLDLVPSTCLHVLRALVAETFVRVDPATKLYTLDAGILPIAHRLLRQDDFAERAQPLLAAIAMPHGVTAIGVRVIGLQHMVVLAVAQPNVAFRLHVEIGAHYPALISATGRCNAAFGGHTKNELKRAFGKLDWDRPPPYAEWLEEVEATRKGGFSVDAGRYIQGVTIIAAPVFDAHGLMSHAVITVGVSERMDKGTIAAIGKSLIAAGSTLSVGPENPEQTE